MYIDELGLILRNAIIWYKPNGTPNSVKDRLSNTYEYVFHFVKSRKYYYNLNFIRVTPSSLNINERRHYLITRLFEWAKMLRASGYNSKSRGLNRWDEILSYVKAYRLTISSQDDRYLRLLYVQIDVSGLMRDLRC